MDTATAASAAPGTSNDPQQAQQAIADLRGEIDALDAEIIHLIQRRLEVSRRVQQVRTAAGGRRLQHGRELVVVNRYASALGAPGTSVAMAILELSRGPLTG